MTNQIQGEILFKGINSAAGTPEYVYSPWMPVGGDKATFGIEIMQITSTITITWGVETRTVEDPTTSVLVANTNHTTTGVKIASPGSDAAKDFVRYRIATGSGADVAQFAILRILPPSWQFDR